MNKATVEKLKNLNDRFQFFEEAVEQRFSAKQVAILRYRIGAEDGAVHELKDVAKKFKCSVSYVTKVTRDITKFMRAKSEGYKNSGKRGTRTGTKVAVMSAVIEDGKVRVNCDDPAMAKEIEQDLQSMVTAREFRMKVGEQALALQNRATTSGIWAFLAMLAAIVVLIATAVKSPVITDLQAVGGYVVALFCALVGLISYNHGVSLMGKRDGLLEALRKM